jgi:glycosyltransferase involved in cell wall biosynthesis
VSRPTLTVVVPAFNEAESLPHTLAAIERAVPVPAEVEAVLVDDGSTDETLAVMRQLASSSALQVQVLARPANGGLGAALASGCAAATGDVVTWIPGDGEYDLAEVLPGIQLLGEHDVVLVRRILRGQAARNFVSTIMYAMIRVLFGFDARRYCGIFVIPRERLTSLGIRSRDVFFTLELALRCSHRNDRIVDIEAEWRPRRAGRSKVFNVRTVIRNVGELVAFRRQLWRED